jgi:hypothetical protein
MDRRLNWYLLGAPGGLIYLLLVWMRLSWAFWHVCCRKGPQNSQQ